MSGRKTQHDGRQDEEFGLDDVGVDVNSEHSAMLLLSSSSLDEQVYLESLECLTQLEEQEDLFRTILEQGTLSSPTQPSNSQEDDDDDEEDIASPLQQRKLHYDRNQHQQQQQQQQQHYDENGHNDDPLPSEIQWNDNHDNHHYHNHNEDMNHGMIFYRNNQDTVTRLYSLQIDHDVEDLPQYKYQQCLRRIRRQKKCTFLLMMIGSITFISFCLSSYSVLFMNSSSSTSSSSSSLSTTSQRSSRLWRLWWTESMLEKKYGSVIEKKTMSSSNNSSSSTTIATPATTTTTPISKTTWGLNNNNNITNTTITTTTP